MAETTRGGSWNGWNVIKKLGEGSFGGVYEIHRTLPNGEIERAALKQLSVPRTNSEIAELVSQNYDSNSITAHFKEQMQELIREYSFMQKLSHNPNVVHCQDMRTVQHKDGIGWDIYIRMELLTPLKQYLGKEYRYDEQQVIQLGLDICNALQSCHDKNIIHRDIKPENIMVDEYGQFKLGDFGIAKISEKTATGTLTGTYSYMAPEIANRQHYGASADIYSLGMVMYWMMNRRTLPFLPEYPHIPTAEQRQAAQDRRFSGEEIPHPLHGSRFLTQIVMKACAFKPQDRYKSVSEMRAALEKLLNAQTDKSEEETIFQDHGKVQHFNKKTAGKNKASRYSLVLLVGILAIVLCYVGIRTMAGYNSSGELTSIAASTASSEPSELSEPEATIPETTVPETEPDHIVSLAKIGVMGELLMHSAVMRSCALPDGSYDFSGIFENIAPELAKNDYNIISLETTFSGGYFPISTLSNFNCPDELAKNIKNVGFNMMLTANNHCADYTITGITRTIDVAQAAGLDTLGTRISNNEPRYKIVDVNGIKIGMVDYTYTGMVDASGRPSLNGGTALDRPELVNYFDYKSLDVFYEEVGSILASMKAEGADTNMFFIHWGTEYQLKEDHHQEEIAQKLCDLGVQVIVGGHPHVVQPMKLLQSNNDPNQRTICIYSLGSAVSNQRGDNMQIATVHVEDGALFSVIFEKHSDGAVYLADVDLLPTWINLRFDGETAYSILPLNYAEEKLWQENFNLSDTMFSQCQNSYSRTTETVQQGLEECQEYLHDQKNIRDGLNVSKAS